MQARPSRRAASFTTLLRIQGGRGWSAPPGTTTPKHRALIFLELRSWRSVAHLDELGIPGIEARAIDWGSGALRRQNDPGDVGGSASRRLSPLFHGGESSSGESCDYFAILFDEAISNKSSCVCESS
jgi:hypothetical protein